MLLGENVPLDSDLKFPSLKVGIYHLSTCLKTNVRQSWIKKYGGDSKQKILPLDTLARRLADLKSKGKNYFVSLFSTCYILGTFTISKKHLVRTILVVTSRRIDLCKGPSRPAFTEILRAETLAHWNLLILSLSANGHRPLRQ